MRTVGERYLTTQLSKADSYPFICSREENQRQEIELIQMPDAEFVRIAERRESVGLAIT